MEKRHISSLISQNFGKFASKEFPKWFQDIVNNAYVTFMGLDMTDYNDRSTYKSLNALFTRKLREDRKYSLDGDDFISPCDSFITECGDIKDDVALQIKGMTYYTDDVLGEHFNQDEKELLRDGKFINFYLSPKDYHRYHIPINMQILKAVHIPGKFYPVNISSLKMRVNLFIENERVILLCETTSKKRFYMVLVSALNVGGMKLSFDDRIQTNVKSLRPQVYEYENLHLNKGDDFGCFEMGSTIVILSEKEMLELNVNTGDNVKYGQTIAKLS